MVVLVVVVAVATASTTTIIIASTTTRLVHDWRSLMVHLLSKKNLATSAASLPDSVWQRRAPGKFGIASNTVLANARGQQAMQASFKKRQARKCGSIFFWTQHASTSVPGQNLLNHFSLACLLVNKLAGSKTVWLHV